MCSTTEAVCAFMASASEVTAWASMCVLRDVCSKAASMRAANVMITICICIYHLRSFFADDDVHLHSPGFRSMVPPAKGRLRFAALIQSLASEHPEARFGASSQ